MSCGFLVNNFNSIFFYVSLEYISRISPFPHPRISLSRKVRFHSTHNCHFLLGILQGVYWGLGGGLGAILGGVLIDAYGAVPSFRLGALMSVVALVASGFIQYCISFYSHDTSKIEKQAVEHAMQ